MIFEIDDKNSFIIFEIKNNTPHLICCGCNEKENIEEYIKQLIIKVDEYTMDNYWLSDYDNTQRLYMGDWISMSRLDIDLSNVSDVFMYVVDRYELYSYYRVPNLLVKECVLEVLC